MGEPYASPWDNFTTVVAGSLGIESSAVDHQISFHEMGGTSLNMVAAVLKLQESGFPVTVEQFVGADNLKGLFESTIVADTIKSKEHKFTIVSITEVDKTKAQTLVAESFLQKCELFEGYNGINVADFIDLYNRLWEIFLPFSNAVIDENQSLRAVALAADHMTLKNTFPDNFHPHLMSIFEMLRAVTEPILKTYNPGSDKGVVLLKYMIGGAIDNTAEENVASFMMIEQELVKNAKKNQFRLTLAENASPLTQQISEYLGCKRLAVCRVKEWTNSAGKQPFIKCSDLYCVTVDIMDLTS